MRYCKKCLLPETAETVTYDAEGICNVCHQIEKKQQIDWKQRKTELDEIIAKYRGQGDYDCIIPYSGGKDSAFTLFYLVRKYELRPLIVTWDHGFFRPQHVEDQYRSIRQLKGDWLRMGLDWNTQKKVMLESLRRKGDFCWHCHSGCFAFPAQVAIKYKTQLVIWGEPSAEYTSYFSYDEKEEVDERRFNRFVNLGITAEDMSNMINCDPSKLSLLAYPNRKELAGFRSICLGSYISWDTKTQSELIRKELGWRGNRVEGIPPQYFYEKCECMFTGVRDYLKFLKRGYGRTAHLMAIELRNGRVTQDYAREMTKKHDGQKPSSLGLFLEILGITEKEFYAITREHVVSPHVPSNMTVLGHSLPDESKWRAYYP